MARYRGFLSNCLIGGGEMTELESGGRVRNLIRLSLDGRKVEIHQHPDVIRARSSDELRGEFVPSTDVVIHDVSPDEKRRADQMMTQLAELLSFATLSPVAFYGWEYPDGSDAFRQWNVVGTAQRRRPTLATQGTDIQSYLTQVWPNYERFRKRRRLNIPISWMVETGKAIPVELLLLIVFTTFENLKSTYAHDRKIPFVSGWFRKAGLTAGNPKKAPKYSFEELLTLMFKDVGIIKGLKRILDLRNDIIHSGISERAFESQWKIFQECHDLAKRYILRLLGYKGQYWSTAAGTMRQA